MHRPGPLVRAIWYHVLHVQSWKLQRIEVKEASARWRSATEDTAGAEQASVRSRRTTAGTADAAGPAPADAALGLRLRGVHVSIRTRTQPPQIADGSVILAMCATLVGSAAV